VTSGTHRSEFTCNGLSQRVKIVEKDNNLVTTTKNLIGIGAEICEERDANNTVTKRYYAEGFTLNSQQTTLNYFYTRDHLGSVRELTDSLGTVQARYDYDPYGRRTKVSGSLDADFGFTGFYFHGTSGLNFSRTRAYDADLGRWISRDPIGERAGINLYRYVGNNVVNLIDWLGLYTCKELCGMLDWAYSGFYARRDQLEALHDGDINRWQNIENTLVPVARFFSNVGPNPAVNAWEHSLGSIQNFVTWSVPAFLYLWNWPNGNKYDYTAWELERQLDAINWAKQQAAAQGCDCDKCR